MQYCKQEEKQQKCPSFLRDVIALDLWHELLINDFSLPNAHAQGLDLDILTYMD